MDFPFLTSLDLTASFIDDTSLIVLSVGHHSSLIQHLSVAQCDEVTMLSLRHFTNLTSLDVSECSRIRDVFFTASSLVELNARGRCGIDDEGLQTAFFIERLDVSHNPRITDTAPFSTSLRQLRAHGSSCGLGDSGLRFAHNLVSLGASDNRRITSVKPFAQSLRFLDATGHSGIGDAGLTNALFLHTLHSSRNSRITTVDPFAQSLRILAAAGLPCGLGDAGLLKAAHLTHLYCGDNRRITTVSPFGRSLVYLVATYHSGVKDEGLVDATSLVYLNVKNKYNVTSIPNASLHSLVELCAAGTSAIDDHGISGAVAFFCLCSTTINTVSP
jgi:hypothetical protein